MLKTLSSCESHPEYSYVYNIEIGLAKLLDVSSHMRHPEGLISIPCWKRMPEAHTPWHSLHSGGEGAAPSLAMDVTGDLLSAIYVPRRRSLQALPAASPDARNVIFLGREKPAVSLFLPSGERLSFLLSFFGGPLLSIHSFRVSMAAYALSSHYAGASLLSSFDFYTGADRNNGFVK